MLIRPATASDSLAITDILRNQPEYPHNNSLLHLKPLPHRLVLVALLETRVIGFIVVHWFFPITAPCEGFIADLFVHQNFTALGAGSALLEAVILEARAKGCSRLALNNWRDKISFHRGFYAKHGFVEKPLSARFVLQFEGLV